MPERSIMTAYWAVGNGPYLAPFVISMDPDRDLLDVPRSFSPVSVQTPLFKQSVE